MRRRLPGWLLLLYVAIDLANPFVAGAFRFSPEEGAVWVEAVRDRQAPRALSQALEADDRIRGGVLPRPAVQFSVATVAVRQPRVEWLVDVRSGDPAIRDLPSCPLDDH